MWHEIAAWQEQLHHRPDLSTKTIALYTQDARRFGQKPRHDPGNKYVQDYLQKTLPG